MGLLGTIGGVIGGLIGRKNNKDNNSANLTATRETNATNLQIAQAANNLSALQVNQAYQRDTAAVNAQRAWDRKQVLDAREWDRKQVLGERQFNLNVMGMTDRRDRARFLQDREWSKNQAALAESRDRRNFLENRDYEAQQLLAAEKRAQNRFLENRKQQSLAQHAAERRQRQYAREDLADARAYSDPAAERARLEAAGFNPLARVDSSSGMNNIGGAIANAPPVVAAPGASPVGGAVSPTARAIEAMGGAGPVASSGGSAASQIAQSQMAKMGIFDPVVAHMTAPTLTADNSLGDSIADAFANYEQNQLAEKELALRKSQIEIENERLSELMQRASMRPSVGGVYSSDVGAGRQAVVDAGGSSTPRLPRLADKGQVSQGSGNASHSNGFEAAQPGRPIGSYRLPEGFKPENIPKYVDVYDQRTGQTVSQLNPDLADAGPLEMAAGYATNRAQQIVQDLQTAGPVGIAKNALKSYMKRNEAAVADVKAIGSAVGAMIYRAPKVVETRKERARKDMAKAWADSWSKL